MKTIKNRKHCCKNGCVDPSVKSFGQTTLEFQCIKFLMSFFFPCKNDIEVYFESDGDMT